MPINVSSLSEKLKLIVSAKTSSRGKYIFESAQNISSPGVPNKLPQFKG